MLLLLLTALLTLILAPLLLPLPAKTRLNVTAGQGAVRVDLGVSLPVTAVHARAGLAGGQPEAEVEVLLFGRIRVFRRKLPSRQPGRPRIVRHRRPLTPQGQGEGPAPGPRDPGPRVAKRGGIRPRPHPPSALPAARRALGYLWRRTFITTLVVGARLGTGDAAATARLYGIIWAAFGTGMALLAATGRLAARPELQLEPLLNRRAAEVELELGARITLAYLIWAGVLGAVTYGRQWWRQRRRRGMRGRARPAGAPGEVPAKGSLG